VDAVGRIVGVKKITRPFIEPKREAAAKQAGVDRWYALYFSPGVDIEEAVRLYAADPSVETAEPVWFAFLEAAPNDPMYGNHWGHNNTGQLPDFEWNTTRDHTGAGVGTVGFDAFAQVGWEGSQGYGSSDVIIAIIDTGVDLTHPDLTLVPGYDFGDNDAEPQDELGHGTACAGIAAAKANNGIGACGAAPGCSIMPLKIFDAAGDATSEAVANAIYYAADNGADVISMSFGGGSSVAGAGALRYAYEAGVTLVAATGNSNYDFFGFPASSAYVIAVGAASPCGDRKRSSSSIWECNIGVETDPNGCTCDGERWWGSNYGVDVADAANAVDVIAPTILPTCDIQGAGGYNTDSDYYPFFNGTSCATPYAAGVCALIKSQNPTYTSAQVRSRLVGTARDIVNIESGAGWDRYTGYGMVDIQGACHVVDVWLDYNHNDGTYLGTYLHPCGSFFQALTNVPAGGVIAIKPGQSHEPLTWPRTITQPMKIIGARGTSVTGQ
jgi:subtilisin family serine protease